MRHAVFGRKLNRDHEHRAALRRNMAQSLFEFGEIRTTVTKAKEMRGFVDELITLAIDGSLASRQLAESRLNDRAIIPPEHKGEYDRMTDAKREKVLRSRTGRRHRSGAARAGLKFTAQSVLHKLFAEIGPKMKQRNDARKSKGGYTRIIKLADRRLGDGGQIAILKLVAIDDAPRTKGSDKTERKRRAKARYSFYAGKAAPRRGARRSKSPAAAKAE